MPHRALAKPIAVLIAVLCGACAHQPAVAPAVPMPTAFAAQQDLPASLPDGDWYRGFQSDELNRLIALARSGNLDVIAAEARIRQANAHARLAGAALLPSLGLDANIAHVRGRADDQSASETDSSAGLTASYELDFWGANRANRDSARLSAAARQTERDTLALTNDAAVANTYFLVLSLRDRIRTATSDLEAARRVLDGIEARFREGLAGPLEVSAEQALVAAAELIPEELGQAEREATVALALLTGRAPEGFTVEATSLDGIAEPRISPGVPADLLTRRPDIASAEYDLRAAHADLLAARAAFFPTITLTTTGALQNPGFNAAVTTLSGTGGSLSLAASLVQAIFDGGRRTAVRDVAAAREEELLANYRNAILAALGDVENAVTNLQQLETQRTAQLKNVTQSEQALEGAQLRYREGAGDLLIALETQRSSVAAHDRLALYKLARLQAIVSLGKALGGGWTQ